MFEWRKAREGCGDKADEKIKIETEIHVRDTVTSAGLSGTHEQVSRGRSLGRPRRIVRQVDEDESLGDRLSRRSRRFLRNRGRAREGPEVVDRSAEFGCERAIGRGEEGAAKRRGWGGG